ncbi:hypothetical protein Tco_0865170 [Tanacetum coccineum]
MPLTTTTATATAAITTTATSSSESSDPDMSPRFSSKFITNSVRPSKVKMDQVEEMMESLAIDESSFDDSDDYVEYQYNDLMHVGFFDFTIDETNNAVQRVERWFSIAAENHLSTLCTTLFVSSTMTSKN